MLEFTSSIPLNYPSIYCKSSLWLQKSHPKSFLKCSKRFTSWKEPFFLQKSRFSSFLLSRVLYTKTIKASMAVNNEMIALEGGGGGGSCEMGGMGGTTLANPTSATTPMIPPGSAMEVTPLDHPESLSSASSDDEMGVRHCFYDFCKQTILHGWHYLADLENDATPSPSFVTFTPVSSPNTALAGQILGSRNLSRGFQR